MLKRLELIGFKSFADRTRLDFAPGITAVVGPNGSGKSNVVDAVKWVLGEQSARALRGGEMIDVIFNGSSTRKSLGMAEVTLTFDNSKRLLDSDNDEVQITRRVYRDGQGEYLINQRDARLKDVRDLFLGTGAGTTAYSIIEQGRVDALLVASGKDRRLIFEEAAGISRFKAKKVEAMRKLEKVDADLTRVRDVLTEQENGLRTLSAQAAKAVKYNEYHARLKELRVGLAAGEYASLTAALDTEQAALAELHAARDAAATTTDTGEAEARKLDWDRTRTDDALRHQEKKLADARSHIAAFEATAKAERDQTARLEEELLKLGRQRAELGGRIRTVEADAARAAAEVTTAAEASAAGQREAALASSALEAVSASISELTRRATADRERQFELVGKAAQHHSAADAARTQADRLARELTRKRAESDRLAAEAEGLARVLADLSEDDAAVQERLAVARQAEADRRQQQGEYRRKADAAQPDLDAKRDRRSALRGRMDVLDNLEQSHDGVGAGVRAVLHSSLLTPHSSLLGLVADLLTVPRELAPLVDLALGDAAQRFVVRDVEAVLATLGDLPGRVGFVPLRECPPVPTGRFSALVSSPIPGLADQLLGNVLLADDFPAARELAITNPTCRILTRGGDLIDPDGTVTVGPPTTAGLLSRKSELRHLRDDIAELDSQIATVEAEQAALRAKADALDAPLAGLAAEIAALASQAGTLRDRIADHRQKHASRTDTVALLGSESEILAGERRLAEDAAEKATLAATAADREAAEVRAALDATAVALAAAETARATRQADHTAAQVNATQRAERLTAARARSDELAAEVRQRKIDLVNLLAADRSARGRHIAATLAALRATASAASAYADADERARKVRDLSATRAALAAARGKLDTDLTAARAARQQVQEQAHARELAARELSARRDSLIARIREEFEVELSVVSRPLPVAEEGTTDEVEELRKKIARLGAVNLEAVEQLAAEEAREKEYRRQYDDLTAAAKSLLEIIECINTDSRRLFTETLNTARGHFQDLFRKLFAGGTADIVLEDGADVLEAGIDVVARPPGKEPRSISQLSGGEKTLTAVALLLALFRSKPSPFCLLDEVDAALDEANAVRLATALQEFQQSSQFIVVTHKKRTMAAAAVLHGISMQEGGVSKRVSVRFEDWPEDARAAA